MSQGVGEVDVQETWQILTRETAAQLIDVRTAAEWNYVGVPDLTTIGKQILLVEWQSFPGGQKNSSFTEQLDGELKLLGIAKDAPLLFICRSGQRSMAAALAMSELGYKSCTNVAGGFEGALDQQKHRGTTSGWKANGLPWVQS